MSDLDDYYNACMSDSQDDASEADYASLTDGRGGGGVGGAHASVSPMRGAATLSLITPHRSVKRRREGHPHDHSVRSSTIATIAIPARGPYAAAALAPLQGDFQCAFAAAVGHTDVTAVPASTSAVDVSTMSAMAAELRLVRELRPSRVDGGAGGLLPSNNRESVRHAASSVTDATQWRRDFLRRCGAIEVACEGSLQAVRSGTATAPVVTQLALVMASRLVAAMAEAVRPTDWAAASVAATASRHRFGPPPRGPPLPPPKGSARPAAHPAPQPPCAMLDLLRDDQDDTPLAAAAFEGVLLRSGLSVDAMTIVGHGHQPPHKAKSRSGGVDPSANHSDHSFVAIHNRVEAAVGLLGEEIARAEALGDAPMRDVLAEVHFFVTWPVFDLLAACMFRTPQSSGMVAMLVPLSSPSSSGGGGRCAVADELFGVHDTRAPAPIEAFSALARSVLQIVSPDGHVIGARDVNAHLSLLLATCADQARLAARPCEQSPSSPDVYGKVDAKGSDFTMLWYRQRIARAFAGDATTAAAATITYPLCGSPNEGSSTAVTRPPPLVAFVAWPQQEMVLYRRCASALPSSGVTRVVLRADGDAGAALHSAFVLPLLEAAKAIQRTALAAVLRAPQSCGPHRPTTVSTEGFVSFNHRHTHTAGGELVHSRLLDLVHDVCFLGHASLLEAFLVRLHQCSDDGRAGAVSQCWWARARADAVLDAHHANNALYSASPVFSAAVADICAQSGHGAALKALVLPRPDAGPTNTHDLSTPQLRAEAMVDAALSARLVFGVPAALHFAAPPTPAPDTAPVDVWLQAHAADIYSRAFGLLTLLHWADRQLCAALKARVVAHRVGGGDGRSAGGASPSDVSGVAYIHRFLCSALLSFVKSAVHAALREYRAAAATVTSIRALKWVHRRFADNMRVTLLLPLSDDSSGHGGRREGDACAAATASHVASAQDALLDVVTAVVAEGERPDLVARFGPAAAVHRGRTDILVAEFIAAFERLPPSSPYAARFKPLLTTLTFNDFFTAVQSF